MADDNAVLPQARGLVSLRTLAKVRQTYPNLDSADCVGVIAKVFENLGNVIQWVDENGVPIANDEPVIRDALLSELRIVLGASAIIAIQRVANDGLQCIEETLVKLGHNSLRTGYAGGLLGRGHAGETGGGKPG